MQCRTCASEDLMSRGKYVQCRQCGDYTKKDMSSINGTFKTNGQSAEVTAMSERRIKTLQDLIEVCEIDTDIWEVDRWEQGKSEGYRKDRKVEWEVIGGEVNYGKVEDSGRLLIVPMFKVKAWLTRKTAEIRNTLVLEDFITKASKYSPKYKAIKYKKNSGCLYEVAMPDLQLGRLVAAEEAGFDLSPEVQIKKANKVMDELIGYTSMYGVSRILFPFGNDFFDSNTAAMTTVHGTPQQDDTRWQRTYKLGGQFMIDTIDKLSSVAPVDILVIPGNHDEERVFYMGEYLQAWYRNNEHVTVNNEPRKRKYYRFDKNLIGLTHGYYEKYGTLEQLMAYEEPASWAETTHREWHLGDKHHKKDMVMKTEELLNGVVVRVLRSLATPSVWEFDKGFVASLKGAEAFTWHPERGVIAQHTSEIT